MIKKYPSTKKVFDSEQKKYEKVFGNLKNCFNNDSGIFIDAAIIMSRK